MLFRKDIVEGAISNLQFIAEVTRDGRPRPEDLDVLRELERQLTHEIRNLATDVKEKILESGIFVKPGDEVTGFTRDNVLETITIWRKGDAFSDR